MLRNAIVIIIALLAFFTVMATVAVIGKLRLKSSWADNGSPVPHSVAIAPVEPPPADGQTVIPLSLDDETDPAEPSTISLPAEKAVLSGHARLEDRRGAAPPPPPRDSDKKRKGKHRDDPRKTAVWITGWSAPGDAAQWSVRPPAAGKYEIDLTYGCGSGWGGDFILSIDGRDLPAHTQSTRNPEEFKVITLSTVTLGAIPTTLAIHPASGAASGRQPLMNLKLVKLIPAG